jgi:hypothetical protein
MSSNLIAIVNAIKALSVTYDSKTISVRDGSSLVQTPNIADLPMRVISAQGTTGGQVIRKTLGASPVINFRWQINDILLGQQVGLGRGVKDQSTALLTYAQSYAQAVRALVTSQWQIEDVTISVGNIEYPESSGTRYHSVTCEFLIKEIIQ